MASDQDPRDPLDPIVGAILEGNPVDWPESQIAGELSPDDRALLEPLRILAAIGRQGRQTSEGDGGDEIDGRFELRGLIGRGASGEVYRAWDSRLQREVALKVVPLDRPFAASVLEEARRLARIRHPGVVIIHDVFDDGRTGRICMELLTGRTLDATVRESGVFSVAGAAQIGEALCDALGSIHEAGLTHGDVKAHNVLVEVSGRVVLMDLGAGARSADQGPPAREGTPLYMAPELFSGACSQPTSDVYSLGVLLYYLLTGGYPISGRTVQDVRAAAERGEAARAALLHVPNPLNRVVARAVDVDQAKRYPSAKAMGRALAGAVRRTRRMFQLVLLAAVIAAGAAFSFWSLRDVTPGPPARGISAREIVLPQAFSGFGGMSQDGSRLLFQDQAGGLNVLDMRSGLADQLASRQSGGQVSDKLMFRPAHDSIVYGWRDDACGCFQIREIPATGGAPRVLASGFAGDDIQLTSVSADGSRALVRLHLNRADSTLNLVELNDGRHQVIGDLARGTQDANLSPDGRLVVYDRPASDTDLGGDLYLLDTATRESRQLLSGRSDDVMPLWAQDSRHVYFSSDRAGVPALWRMAIDGPGTRGEPQIVHRDIGRFIPLAIADDGALLFWTTPILDIETAPFDAAAGLVSGLSRALPVGVAGSSYELDWSPDGAAIAYSSERRASGAARSVLVIHTLATGEEREIRVPVNGYFYPAWSPDGSRLLIRGPGSFDNSRGPRIVDVQTGSPGAAFGFGVGSYAWSPGGRTCYVVTDDGLRRVETETRTVTPIPLQGDWRPSTIVLSPDGSQIAANAMKDGRRAIILVGVGGGSPQVLSAPGDNVPELWDWTPDGARLLGIRAVDPRERWGEREFVTISVATGRIEPAGLRRPGLTSISLRSDGAAIAYRKGLPIRKLWLMERLPPPPISDR